MYILLYKRAKRYIQSPNIKKMYLFCTKQISNESNRIPQKKNMKAIKIGVPNLKNSTKNFKNYIYG